MFELFKKNIIRLLRHGDYRPVKVGQLARLLGVSDEDYEEFKKAYEQLRQSGRVVTGSRSLVSLPEMSSRVTGTFRANKRGFGFITPLDATSHGDLFVAARDTGGAMNGDTVEARVVKRGHRGLGMRYSGKVVEILERGESKFVGTLLKGASGWIVNCDGGRFAEPISVDDVGAKEAKEKDKVVVEILSYPEGNFLARGVIVEVLGKAGKYESEIKSIIRQYRLPEEFGKGCVDEARAANAGFEAKGDAGREDITGKVIITIDPETAKDFDDAISIEKVGGGNVELGIHIADVSSFIPVGSALDVEAKERGNSIYLPQKTIPMLPEILSNGICSLQPGQRRFCKSAYITYDKDGNVLSSRFANSLIESTQRLTYVEAEKILRGKIKDVRPEVVELLGAMESLSKVIETRRQKNEMLHLDLPETELVFDKAGQVVDAEPADTSYPHTIIEMFMVEANEAVARLIDGLNVALMRRIHPEPDGLSMKSLSKLIRGFGYRLPREPDRASIQSLLGAVRGTDKELSVNMGVLRSFEKAEYSPVHIGHWALASTHYCHFTSPIRRYADLLVHRVLQCHLDGRIKAAAGKEVLSEGELKEIGSHITFTENRAESAERELKEVLILGMLSKKIGSKLDCVVSGLAGFGVFVQCKKFGIEGLIQTEDLGADKWEFNQKAHCVTGVRSGYTLRLGEEMTVRIISVNVAARQLNVAPAEPLFDASKTKRKKVRRGRKGKTRGKKRK
ncbi:MAG: ribonuclease R [Planctomycetes bacterium]|nr:ribonuclease R [Planctomycetota bacterium]